MVSWFTRLRFTSTDEFGYEKEHFIFRDIACSVFVRIVELFVSIFEPNDHFFMASELRTSINSAWRLSQEFQAQIMIRHFEVSKLSNRRI
jgi:hypothetical protein